jgi:aconitate hydratase
MAEYLASTGKQGIAELAGSSKNLLEADSGCKYDRVFEIKLSELKTHVNGPFTPDLANPIEQQLCNTQTTTHFTICIV